jgi:hypothetical protein
MRPIPYEHEAWEALRNQKDTSKSIGELTVTVTAVTNPAKYW